MSRSKRKIFSEQKQQKKRGLALPVLAVVGGSMVAIGVVLHRGSTEVGVGAAEPEIIVYKSPTCGCCGKWVDHLEDAGFSVKVKERSNMAPVKADFGVSPRYQSCHTASIDGYFVEGHVPAKEIRRLIAERPYIRGLAVPGMPMGSPGMEGDRVDSYQVLAVDHGNSATVFSQY